MSNISLSLPKFFLIASLFSIVIVTHFTIFPFVVGKIIFFRATVELALFFFLIHLLFFEKNSTISGRQWLSFWGLLPNSVFRSFSPRSIRHAKKVREDTPYIRSFFSHGSLPNMDEKSSKSEFGSRPYWQILRSPIVIAVTIFVVIFSFAGFFSIDPVNSFWSNYIRGEGVFQMWHYYAFFVLSVLLFRDEKDWRKVLIFSLIAIGLSLLFGIIPWLQSYHVDTRFKGAIGNPAFTATALLFGLFYSIYLLRSFASVSWRDRSLRTTALVLYFLISLSFLFLTGTRGALLGLLAGIAVLAIILAWSNVKNIKKFFTPLRMIIGLIVLVSCLLSLVSLFYFQPFRIFQISLKEQTAQTRFWIWQSAIKGWRERPVLGWGPENFPEVFDKYFDQRHGNANDGKEVWIDRAHNVFIGYLTDAGILGLLAYLGIWAAYFYMIYKFIASARDLNNLSPLRRPVILFLIFPVIYLVQGLLIFETLPVYLNLFLFLGFASWQFSHSKPFDITQGKLREEPSSKNFQFSQPRIEARRAIFKNLIFKTAIIILILMLPVAFYLGSYRPLIKSILFNNALAKVDQISSAEEFKNNFSLALNYWSPYGQQEELRMLGGVIMDLLKKNSPVEVARALVNYLNKNYQNFKKWEAQDYYILGRVNELGGNKDLAERFYKEAHAKWPFRLEFKKNA